MSYILLSYFNKFFLPLSLKNVSRHQFHQQIYRLSFKFYIQAQCDEKNEFIVILSQIRLCLSISTKRMLKY